MKKLTLMFSALLFITLLFPVSAMAQTGSELKISPTLIEIDAQPGDRKSVSVTLTNVTSSPSSVTTSVRDFIPGADGQPKLLGDDEISEYGIKTWDISASDFAIGALEDRAINFEFTVPSDAKNRTYQSSVLFKSVSEDFSDLQSSVGVLLFVNVGSPVYAGSIQSSELVVQSSGSTDTLRAVVALSNDGDYKFTPSFEIDLLSSDGVVLETVTPDDAGAVLPGQTRTYEFDDLMTRPIDDEEYLIVARAKIGDKIVSSDIPETTVPTSEPVSTSVSDDALNDTDNSSDGSFSVLVIAISTMVGLAVLAGMAYIVIRLVKGKRDHLSVIPISPIHQQGLDQSSAAPVSPVQPQSPTHNVQLEIQPTNPTTPVQQFQQSQVPQSPQQMQTSQQQPVQNEQQQPIEPPPQPRQEQ